VNRWENDAFLRWEPKGKISFETAFTTFDWTEYGEGVGILEYPYWGQILAKEKGAYSEYQFSFRVQYHFFHSLKNHLNCYAGISSMLNLEDYIAYSWYYHNPDTANLINAARYKYKSDLVWVGLNTMASYQINNHFVLHALLQFQTAAFGLIHTEFKDSIAVAHYGFSVMTYQLGISYSFKY